MRSTVKINLLILKTATLKRIINFNSSGNVSHTYLILEYTANKQTKADYPIYYDQRHYIAFDYPEQIPMGIIKAVSKAMHKNHGYQILTK